jgi:hypothetical protein
VEGWAKPGEDVLYQLGKQSPSMRIDMGARSGIIDDLCVCGPRGAAAATQGESVAGATSAARVVAPRARSLGARHWPSRVKCSFEHTI